MATAYLVFYKQIIMLTININHFKYKERKRPKKTRFRSISLSIWNWPYISISKVTGVVTKSLERLILLFYLAINNIILVLLTRAIIISNIKEIIKLFAFHRFLLVDTSQGHEWVHVEGASCEPIGRRHRYIRRCGTRLEDS